MSRIGKKPVTIPAGVEVKVDDTNKVSVKGPKGRLEEQITPKMKVEVKQGEVIVERPDDSKSNRSLHGLSRSLINNMVIGVTDGYEKKLEITGVGYKAEKQGKKLVLNLGYSHPIELMDPEGITTEAPSTTQISIKGISKAEVGNYAAIIRGWRPPEPYKGKGIKYAGEYIRRKEGKAGVKGE